MNEYADNVLKEINRNHNEVMFMYDMLNEKDKVWIPYREAAKAIEEAAILLLEHEIDVKLYNFPLCTVKNNLWTLCEKSISPDKVRYSDVCSHCKMRKSCGGVFAGTISIEKGELKAIV